LPKPSRIVLRTRVVSGVGMAMIFKVFMHAV
jgi:hypothetical protein